MVSSGNVSVSGNGDIIKAERPSAIFYPNQIMGKKSKSVAKDVVDGWQSQESP
jgi:hypothetical protein